MAGAWLEKEYPHVLRGARGRIAVGVALALLALCLVFVMQPTVARADEDAAAREEQTVEAVDAATASEAEQSSSSESGAENALQDSAASAANVSSASLGARAQSGATGALSQRSSGSAQSSGTLAERLAVLVAGEGVEALAENAALALRAQEAGAMFATGTAVSFSQGEEIEIDDDGIGSLVATFGGTIVGDQLSATTKGAKSPAVMAGRGGGNVSLAHSALETAGADSPLVQALGVVELGNTTGTAADAQLVSVEGAGCLLLHGCELSSGWTGGSDDDGDDDGGEGAVVSAVTLYQTTPQSEEAQALDGAVFQAVDSKLQSKIESGAFFHLSNTSARVLLVNTQLDYDSSAAKLAIAAADASNEWGTEGANGATAVLTGINQQLKGDIEVDELSFFELFLLHGSTWTGSSSVVKSQKANAHDDLDVAIDSSSKWVVTANSTVTNLNVESGGKLVDEQGKAVKVADKDGNVLVEGRSELTVTVKGEFSTTITTSAVNDLRAPSIDRSAFDDAYGTDTSFGPDVEWTAYSDEARALAAQETVRAWFESRFTRSAS